MTTFLSLTERVSFSITLRSEGKAWLIAAFAGPLSFLFFSTKVNLYSASPTAPSGLLSLSASGISSSTTSSFPFLFLSHFCSPWTSAVSSTLASSATCSLASSTIGSASTFSFLGFKTDSNTKKYYYCQ